ncbi:carotenoid biosynthesis protein [Rhodococcus chondri]|uniref:Carotenoid biosynthesis protein n=1 Tax=Rhodococcus chondri TaxID=3065941 RepID=A0ABU7JNB5_9NOCA|nr:carotenoid biosynthesis protein [Rhodococcus sp. CC-R104]MEE2031526.1 carotenoid biosynthesis protein [Rhodococcus sp. CC-R104]
MTTRGSAALPWILLAGAIAAQIAYPLTDGAARDRVTVAVVVLLAATCLVHATLHRGARWAAALFGITAGVGYASEVLGTSTGYPYGCYAYAVDRLGPSVFDVPLVVPLAWTAGMYPIWCVASRIFPRPAARLAAVTVAMVGWDLYLDPQMVADGQWTWCHGGGLPGIEHIPLTNYAGWTVVAAMMALALYAVDRRAGALSPRGDAVPTVLFLWTWLGSALAHSVFLDAPELRWSALYGAVVMGTLGVPLLGKWAVRRQREARRRRAASGRVV